MDRTRFTKLILTPISLTVFGIVFALIILEIILHFYSVSDLRSLARYVFGEKLVTCQTKDSFLDHKLIPNCSGVIVTPDFKETIKTDSLGIREDEVGEKKPGVKRVLILGDSYAEGWGVNIENRYDRVAKSILTNNVEIIDAGVRSYSPILELEYLRTKGIKFKPDYVVLFYDVSDLHDDYYYGGWDRFHKVENELGMSINDYGLEEWPPDTESNLVKLFMNSKLFANFYLAINSEISNQNHKFTRKSLMWDVTLFGKGEKYPEYNGKVWNLNTANLYLINDYLQKNNIGFAVAIVPRGMYVSPKEWDKGRELLGVERNKLYAPIPYEVLGKNLAARNIPVVDLLTSMKNSNEFPLFYPSDGHWTKDGNKIVGETLANFLDDKLQLSK